MTYREGKSGLSSTVQAVGDEMQLADRVASEIRQRWRRGARPDMAAVLEEHPELMRHRSIVLDLAHDEYRYRLDAGESLDAGGFSRRFPSLESSLYLLIEVHDLLDGDPDFRTLRERVQWPEPGQSFLGFSLIGELGRGTFGHVFLASEPALGDRLVALKVAPHGGEEAEMLGKLQHPNIVPVYSVQEDPATGLTAVCMPYLGRATLRDVVDRVFVDSRPPHRARSVLDVVRDLGDVPDSHEPASTDRLLGRGSYVDGIVHVAIQLADALAYTHSRGICHRDLKPSNVLLSAEGRPLLLDFNLSADQCVSAVRIGGTLPYMAPEQLQTIVLHTLEQHRPVDPRSDLFSLGVILYELLAGSLPFGEVPWGDSVEEVAENLLRRQEQGPRPIRDHNPRVDQRLAAVIDHCLAFDPEGRPETAAGLAALFRRQLRPVARARRWARNHPRRVSLFGVVAAVAILAAASYLALRDPYSVRQYKRGIEYLEESKYALAVDCFHETIQIDPDNDEALLARARAHLGQKDFRMAFEDLQTLSERSPTPEVFALKGYCLSKLRHHADAIDCYRLAQEGGVRSASLLNNTAFSHAQLNRLEDAEECLNEAVGIDANLQAAHHNLVVVFVRRARRGEPIPQSAFVHAKRAVATGPGSADLYLDVAAIYALGSQEDASLVGPALESLKRAVALGLDVKRIRSDPVFASVVETRQWSELLHETGVTPSSVETDLLVKPF
ncbi:MAG: protein kinase [Candidatus Nealsonbacteria bacterium]|nr:protein kinase [Candidatus Nealsonbacteria bacterium]